MVNYKIQTYRKWIQENIKLTDAFAPASLKEITHHILMGRNYRLLTEDNTKQKLLTTYIWLSDVVRSAKREYGINWKEEFLKELINIQKKTPEQRDLIFWMLGTTRKGAVNLGIEKEDYSEVLSEMIKYCKALLQNIKKTKEIDDAWLFMMAGSATLNIRGSDKSKIGKQIEGVIVKAILTLLGLEQGKSFWMNIQRDLEVEREADAEIATRRGRVRIEVGLIAQGNQEVIEDKIGRVGRNGIVFFDKIGARSRIHQTAMNAGVKLIQIRGNQPLVEAYRHIQPLVDITLNEPPELEKKLRSMINALPENIFDINSI
jgi:hypothetical protein